MKKFILHGEMADLFVPEIELDVSTPNEAIRGLCANFPTLRRYIIEKSSQGVNYQFIDQSDNKYDGYCGHIILKDDQYDIVTVPEGYGAAMGMMSSFMGTPLGAGIANAALGYGMQKLTNKFTKDLIQQDDVPEYEIIQTNSFIYTQNENKTEQGSPIPVIYGQLRVGTKVINSSVENYDYDHEDAFIYPNPPDVNQVELIHGGQFSFVLPIDYDDYRDETEQDALPDWSPEGKRSLSFGAKGAKNFDPENNNESQAEGYDFGGNEYGASSSAKFGPSSRRPLKKTSGKSGYKESSNVRPYLFPVDGALDVQMRPSSKNSLCVERTQKFALSDSDNASNDCLAWVGSNSAVDQMRVGNRGDYQKLESIGLYKSLEVLSEGPIAGLALPISSDIDQDSGPVTYPLESTDISSSSKTIKLDNLKYHDYSNSDTELADLSQSVGDNSPDLTIISQGQDYKDKDGNLLNGSISVLGNDIVDQDHKVRIKVQKPGNNYAAEIQDAFFDDTEPDYFSSQPNRELYLSDNRIFIIDPETGEVMGNDNSGGNPYSLSSKYYNSNGYFKLDELEADPVENWPEEEEQVDFFAGENYPNRTYEYTINPESKPIEFDLDVGRSSHVVDIHSKAQCVDLGALLGYDVIGQTVSTTYREIERYTEDDNIPYAVDADGEPFKWEDMCRIYLHSTSDLPVSKSTLEEVLYIPVGYIYRKDGLPFLPNTDLTKGGRRDWGATPEEAQSNMAKYGDETVFVNGTRIDQTRLVTAAEDHTRKQLYLPIRIDQFLGMKEIPDDWMDWTNWYIRFGSEQNPNYNQVYQYTQEHRLIERDASGYPQWTNIQTYSAGDLVSYGNDSGDKLLYQAKVNIEGDPDVDSFPHWLAHYDYPEGSMVQYEGEAYRATRIVRGVPDVTNLNSSNAYWSRYNTYFPHTFLPEVQLRSPQPSNYNVGNTVVYPTGSQGELGYFARVRVPYNGHPRSTDGTSFSYTKPIAPGFVIANNDIVYECKNYIPEVTTWHKAREWNPTEHFYQGEYVRFYSYDQSSRTNFNYLKGRGEGTTHVPDVFYVENDVISPIEPWREGRSYNSSTPVYVEDLEAESHPYTYFKATGNLPPSNDPYWDEEPNPFDGSGVWTEISYHPNDEHTLSNYLPQIKETNSWAAGHSSFSIHFGYSYNSNGSYNDIAVPEINKVPWDMTDTSLRAQHWNIYELNDYPTDSENFSDWSHVRVDGRSPPEEIADWGSQTRWEHVPVDNIPPPVPMQEPWSDIAAYSVGDCVIFGDELYVANVDIDGVVDASTLPIWSDTDPYGLEIDADSDLGTAGTVIHQVQYDGDAYQLKTDPATNDYYEIAPENESQFLTDDQVAIIYNSDTTTYSHLAPDEDGIYPSVAADSVSSSETNAATLISKMRDYVEYDPQPTPDADFRWELITRNSLPSSSSDWTVSAEWKAFINRSFEPFDKSKYAIHSDYSHREGIIQNPDPTAKNPGGLVGAVGGFFGGKPKWTRQSTRVTDRSKITRISRGWQRIISGGGSTIDLGEILMERYETSDPALYPAVYATKIKKLGKSKMKYRIAEGTTLYYSQGPDLNDKIIDMMRLKGIFGSGTSPENNFLTTKEERFPNSRQSGSLGATVTMGSFFESPRVSYEGQAGIVQRKGYRTNQTRTLRFSIGHGGSNSYSDFSYMIDESFPAYMLQGGTNRKKLYTSDSSRVKMFRKGYNPLDDSDNPYGFYLSNLTSSSIPHYPRVTVFIIRKRANGLIDFCPTTIEAIAKVDTQDGVIESVHMLTNPEKPVYDVELLGEGSDGFSHIYPQDVDYTKPYHACEGKKFQDIGVYLKIDASHGYERAMFNAKNGQLDSIRTPENGYFGLYASWKNHIQYDAVGVGGGIEKPICVNGQNIQVKHFGNVSGEITVSTEHQLAVPGSADAGLPSVVDTGRVKSFTVSEKGNNYGSGSAIQSYIFNQKFEVTSIQGVGTEKGYKPSLKDNTESFIIFGLPKSIFDQYHGQTNSTDKANLLNQMHRFCKFKARVFVNQFGRIQSGGEISHPIIIIDSGYSLANEDDELIFFNSSYHAAVDGFTTSQQDDLDDIIAKVYSLNDKIDHYLTQGGDDASDLLMPDANPSFPKRAIKIQAIASQGKLMEFKVIQTGLGFNHYETIKDPFQQISFTAPTFLLNFSNGILQSAQLDLSKSTSGYSPNDTSIRLKVSRPFQPRPPGVPAADELLSGGSISDPFAKFRCIYLNDVPIRDHTGRFNYSKFHFDMRIGHFENPTNQHPYHGVLATDASHQLMSPEFRVPTHTKFIEYPLFGPRNEGEKDYYYSHTIKNPAVSDVSFSIRINQLHYIYEGDEAAVYLNLLPIIGMVLGYMFGVWLAKKVISEIFPEFTISTGLGVSTGFSLPSFKSALEVVAQIAAYAAIQAGGILFAMLAFKWITKYFKCQKVPWLCIKIGELIKNSGEIWPAQMRIRIEYGIEGETLHHDTIEFRGCATSSYVKDIYINNLEKATKIGTNSEVKKNRIFRVYRLTRELDPVTGGLAEARYKIDADLLSITEYVGGYFSYPNTALVGTRFNSKDHPSVPRREFLIKGRLIRIPSNYNPIDGTYDQAWDGQFKPELHWTSNPAWIIFDLLTDNRYGMGKYGIKDEDVDKWSFYKFAKRCDEKVDVIVDGISSQERRHMCNVYIDSERQAYDYIRDLMNIYSSKINFSAGTIHIVQDAPAEGGPVMLFNNSNISEKGFSYSSTPETDRITAVTVDFIDERDNYMNKTEYVEDAEGVREHGYKHVKIAGLGITRRGEAHRLAWHKILTKQLEKEVVMFEAGIRASYLRIGDVIEVLDNNKVSNHSGGRVVSIINSNTIEIDIPVAALGNATSLYIESPVQEIPEWAPNTTFLAGSTVIHLGEFYKNLDGNNPAPPDEDNGSSWTSAEPVRQKQFEEYSISSKSGFNITLSQSISNDIKTGFTWIVKENDEDKVKPRQYKVKQVREMSSLQYEVVGTEHFEDKYNQIDNATGSEKGIEFESREYYGPPISPA